MSDRSDDDRPAEAAPAPPAPADDAARPPADDAARPPADPTAAPPARSGRTVLQVVVMAILGLAVPLAGVVVAARSCNQTQSAGRVEVTGSPAGDWQARLGACRSALDRGERAVELGRRDDGGPLVRIAVDPLDGPVVTLWNPSGDRTFELRGGDCPALRVELRSSGDGDGERLGGSAQGTCPLAAGGTVTLGVWWRGC